MQRVTYPFLVARGPTRSPRQNASSACGGARAGASGGGVLGKPRHTRMAAVTLGSVRKAKILTGPRQSEQVCTSTWWTRRRSSTQGSRRGRRGADGHGSVCSKGSRSTGEGMARPGDWWGRPVGISPPAHLRADVDGAHGSHESDPWRGKRKFHGSAPGGPGVEESVRRGGAAKRRG